MKSIHVALVTVAVGIICCSSVADNAAAQPSTNLKIMIFPLECSVDLTNVGVGVYRNLTPENCTDPIEEPVTPVPVETPGVEQPSSELANNPVPVRAQYPNFYTSLGQVFLPTDMSDESLQTVPIIKNADDTHIIKSLPDASSLVWVPYIIIGIPVLLLLFRLGQTALLLIRRR